MIKWGIYGAGAIAEKYAHDFANVGGGKVIAAYARNVDKISAFCSKYKIDKSYTDENDFFSDPEIELVYIATPHVLHAKTAIKALNAGKHVLCEKPFAMNYREAKEVLDLANSKGLFVMEALWTLFLPTIIEVKKKVDDGAIGKLEKLVCSFGFKSDGPPEGRLLNPELGGGGLLDVGIYTVMIANYFLSESYDEMKSSAIFTNTGVDGTVCVELTYSDKRSATLKASIIEDFDNKLILIGDAGTIEVPQFWEANHALLIKEVETHKVEYLVPEYWGYHYEIEHVCKMIEEGALSSNIATQKFTLELMKMLDDIRSQIGLKYSSDGEI